MRAFSVITCAVAALAACSVPALTFTPTDDGGAPPTDDASAPACDDRQRNGSETDVDCGGGCGPCTVGLACTTAGDCTTGVCTADRCQAAACDDGVKNGDETDVDCGNSCGACSNGLACDDTTDCRSGVCVDLLCQAATCTDAIKNGQETDLNCGGPDCAPCAVGATCAIDTDCATGGICDASACRLARSCDEILRGHPGSASGVYTIAPFSAEAYSAVCDMTDDGGWTLLLKANGDATLGFDAAAWTNDALIAPDDLTTTLGNAKYPAFLSLPVTRLRGELDGYSYRKTFATQTARQIFSGGAEISGPYAPLNPIGAPWSMQPNCQTFGVNTEYPYAHTRFGWTANQEPNCETNDTAIGLGLSYTYTGLLRGAGYICLSSECNFGTADAAGHGLLWGQ